MREIKFRAWGPDGMTEVVVWNLDKQLVNDNLINPPLMEYTGLKDSNGVEIYEGDILQGSTGLRYPIAYDTGTASFGVEGIDPQEWIEFTVVGNIYENEA